MFDLRVVELDFSDGILQPVRRQQIGLFDEVEDLVFLPVLVLESFVARLGRNDGRALPAQHAARGRFP